MGVLGERRRGRGVELGLEAPQGLDHRVGGLDRVGALARLHGMGGRAQHAHLEPQHADLGVPDRAARRLGQDRGVGRVPGQHAGERAVARALLLDDRLELHPRARREAEPLQAADGADHRHEPRLHVAGAAPVHPLALDARAVGVAGPQRGRLGADDVDVAVEDQRAAVGGAGGASPRARWPCRRRPSRRARPPDGARAPHVQRHLERLEPELGERPAHDRLPGRLVAEQRARRHELGQQRGHRGRLGRDRLQDLPVHAGDPTS